MEKVGQHKRDYKKIGAIALGTLALGAAVYAGYKDDQMYNPNPIFESANVNVSQLPVPKIPDTKLESLSMNFAPTRKPRFETYGDIFPSTPGTTTFPRPRPLTTMPTKN